MNTKTTITINKQLASLIKIEAAKRYMTIAEYVQFMYDNAPKED